jgi:hypothetical protein
MARAGLIQREKDRKVPETRWAVLVLRRGVRSRDSADSRRGHRVILQNGLPVLQWGRWWTTRRLNQ